MNKLNINRELVLGSIILLVTFNIYNLLNFVFQFSMARLLSIADYGALATIMSVIYITGIFSESIQNLMTKHASEEKNLGKLKNIFKRISKRMILASIIIFVAYIVLAIPFSFLSHISYPLLALNGLMIFAAFFIPVSRGLLLGRKKFYGLGINLIVESSIKLIFAIGLVIIGARVYGAITGIILGSLVAFFISFINISDIIKSKEKQSDASKIKLDIKPIFIITSCLLLFYSVDIIIARMVFSPEVSGAYAIISILSKAMFWGTQPISRAMFPMTSEKVKKDSRILLLNAVLFVSITLIVALLALYFFSDKIISVFSGKTLVGLAEPLMYLSLGTSALAFTNLVLLYKLSKNAISKPSIFIVFILIEVIALFVFSSTIQSFSLAFLISSVIFLIGASLISIRNKK
ncbi:MAG: oligosaccharide flippase family protein [archaeon]